MRITLCVTATFLSFHWNKHLSPTWITAFLSERGRFFTCLSASSHSLITWESNNLRLHFLAPELSSRCCFGCEVTHLRHFFTVFGFQAFFGFSEIRVLIVIPWRFKVLIHCIRRTGRYGGHWMGGAEMRGGMNPERTVYGIQKMVWEVRGNLSSLISS